MVATVAWLTNAQQTCQLPCPLYKKLYLTRRLCIAVQRTILCPYLFLQTWKMFKNTFQSGFLSILYSIGSKPLQIWDKKVRNGHIKRITDNDIQSFVLEILGTNVSTTFITCPADPRKTLGIRLPYLIMIVKNMKKYFTFEVQILDDKNVRRRFRASNFQSTTRVKPFICTMPMRLDEGWNQIQFNLADFTRRAYGTSYVETLRVQIHANCRIRRVYFADRLYSEDELPAEFKLYLPVQARGKV
ncbi:cilia- and flagella-associated protein 20 [Haemaphysalis longicornis]